MGAHETETGDKKRYTTPTLTIHGTLQGITLMRFNWQRREWGETPIDNVS